MKKHKSEKIHEVVLENDRNLNLHEIKAETGAGNGHSSTSIPSEVAKHNSFIPTSKFQKIHQMVTNIEGKVNLHKIKAQTGAGNGYITEQDLQDDINTPTCDSSNHKHHSESTSKIHKIHAVFHANDRKLNLHQIKQKTGAGNGYKNKFIN